MRLVMQSRELRCSTSLCAVNNVSFYNILILGLILAFIASNYKLIQVLITTKLDFFINLICHELLQKAQIMRQEASQE